MAKDVCDELEIGNVSQALSYLDEDERAVITNEGLSNSRNGMVALISESGLYSLILRSRKPVATQFKKWITGIAISSIRRHGTVKLATLLYMDDDERMKTNPTLWWLLQKEISVDYQRIRHVLGVDVFLFAWQRMWRPVSDTRILQEQ